jgi:catechol 2,3-dioxygenase-like lactoylglutathione lyase family enzyme
MPVLGLDHINIATCRLEETRAFYMDVLGLSEGWRPDFPFRGHWLYSAGRPIVHLQESEREVTPSALSTLNHFAFQIADFDALLSELDQRGIPYQQISPPGTAIRQAFLKDPNGAIVELNFRP